MFARTPARAIRAGSPSRCPFCHDGVDDPAGQTVCAGCLARHHGDCWDQQGSCASCGQAAPLVTGRPSPPAAGELEPETEARLHQLRGVAIALTRLRRSSPLAWGLLEGLAFLSAWWAYGWRWDLVGGLFLALLLASAIGTVLTWRERGRPSPRTPGSPGQGGRRRPSSPACEPPPAGRG